MMTCDQIRILVKVLLPYMDCRSLEVCSNERNSTYCYSSDRASLQGKSDKMEKRINLTAIKEVDLASLWHFMKEEAERKSSHERLSVLETGKRVER